MRIDSERIVLVNDGDIGRLTPLKYAPVGNYGATSALISVLTGDGMFRVDSQDPDSENGHPVAASTDIDLDSFTEIQNFRIYQNGDTAVTFFVTYFFEDERL